MRVAPLRAPPCHPHVSCAAVKQGSAALGGPQASRIPRALFNNSAMAAAAALPSALATLLVHRVPTAGAAAYDAYALGEGGAREGG